VDIVLQYTEALFTAIGIIVVVVFVGEFGPDIKRAAHQKRNDKKFSDADSRSNADAFKSVDWGPKYFFEYWSALGNIDWHDYVYGRCHPYSGKYINIDKSGLRKTWQPDVGQNGKVLEVFFFGGSVGWGMGARDEHTIPSALAKLLNKSSSTKVNVTNFSENGHCATQEMLTLILALRQGKAPDVVIFLHGVNDCYSAFQQGVAGIPNQRRNREIEFNVLHPQMRKKMFKRVLPIVFRRTLRIIDRIVGWVTPMPEKLSGVETEAPDALAEEAKNIYIDVMDTIQLLGGKKNFKSFFFWTPTIFSKNILTEYEEQERDINKKYSAFFDAVNSKVASDLKNNSDVEYYDFLHLFDKCEEGIFLDFAHISERGNLIVAEKMLPFIEGALKEKRVETSNAN
jgi:lysophospholipase L1-like esterase